MKRLLLTIAYDGTNYSGWQKQPNERTIQGEIEGAIFRSIGERVEVFGSGRTDAGVHALGQSAHFDLSAPVPTSKIKDILNDCLPDDICIKSVKEVNENFHARFSIKKKTYLYKIYNGSEKDAFCRFAAWVKSPLDERKMEKAASILIGEHDFRGFCSSKTCATDFVRTIYDINIWRDGDFVDIEVTGSGFLYNMVRILVGTMVDFAQGKLDENDMKTALISGDRSKSGQTMPAKGLFLKETAY